VGDADVVALTEAPLPGARWAGGANRPRDHGHRWAVVGDGVDEQVVDEFAVSQPDDQLVGP
jgi:hypothetical protein